MDMYKTHFVNVESVLKRLINGDDRKFHKFVFNNPPKWNIQKQSSYIESLLMRLPQRDFVVAEQKNMSSVWAVVDGVNRLMTIKNFYEGKLVLTGLQYLTNINGATIDSAIIQDTQHIFSFKESNLSFLIIVKDSELYDMLIAKYK